ncbi:MAG: AAA family ATPase, partial [Gammaproteobacteria bacterium]
MNRQAFFVTGTDTDAGKTLVALSLLHAAHAKGLSTLGLKPVAAGGSLHAGE